MLLDNYRIKFEKPLISRIFAFLLDTVGFLLSFFLPKSSIKTPRNILIIRKDEMGDNLLSTPIYEVIKKNYPRAKITLLTTDYTSDLFKYNLNIDKLLIIEPFWRKKNPVSFLKGLFSVVRKIKAEKFDVGIDPKGSLLNILMLYLSNIKKTISYYNVTGGRFMLTNPVFYAKQVHEIECNINLLKEIGIKPRKPFPLPKLYTSNEEKEDVEKLIKRLNLENFIYIYTTPSSPHKRWSTEKFREIIDAFPDRQFLLCGLSKEKEIINAVSEGKKNCVVFYDLNPRKLHYLLKKAAAILAVDGGPMHLAWSANKNTVAMFGQQDEELWKPLNHSILICHCPKSEQGLSRKPLDLYNENKYMAEITVDEVKNKLNELLK